MSTIEVFADVSCPFAHVGLRRLVDLRTERDRPDVQFRVRAWPLEIVNGEPLDADFIGEEVDDIRTQVAADLFRGFSTSAFPATTVPALALAAAAYRRDLSTGERVSLALRDLLFEQGVDVSDPDILAGLADEHDVTFDPADVMSVEADHTEGVERGVVGSPHFFTPDGGFFCPSLDIHRDDGGHLQITTDPAEFEAFAASCFA